MKAILAAAGLAMALAGCSGAAPDEEVTAAEEVTYPGVPAEQAAQIRAAGKVIDPASFAIFATVARSTAIFAPMYPQGHRGTRPCRRSAPKKAGGRYHRPPWPRKAAAAARHSVLDRAGKTRRNARP